jgi:hypothetical protein
MIIHELARDGVRAGVVGAKTGDIKDQITGNVLITLAEEDIDVEPSDASRALGGPLKVSVEHEFDILTPFLESIFPDGKWTLTAEYVMRIEQLPET